MYIYSIYDSKAEAYLRPFFCPNDQVAIRSFITAIQDPSTDFFRHAGDYTLFQIGEFNEHNGKIAATEVHQNLGCAIQFSSHAAAPRHLNLLETPEETSQ